LLYCPCVELYIDAHLHICVIRNLCFFYRQLHEDAQLCICVQLKTLTYVHPTLWIIAIYVCAYMCVSSMYLHMYMQLYARGKSRHFFGRCTIAHGYVTVYICLTCFFCVVEFFISCVIAIFTHAFFPYLKKANYKSS
jgi:hypothetical protein